MTTKGRLTWVRLLVPVKGTALDPARQFGVSRVKHAGGPRPHDRRKTVASTLRVLGVGQQRMTLKVP